MGKTFNQTEQDHEVPGDQIDQSIAAMTAKRDFVTYALNMGWQLALIVLIPVFIGVKLDDKFDTSPSYTLASFVLAVSGAVMVVSQTLKQVAKKQASKLKDKDNK